MPSELTFAQVSEVNRSRCLRWHPGFPDDEDWSLADWSNAMAGEAGEACNVVKKIRRHQCGLIGQLDPPLIELRIALAEELADVFLYLDLLASKAGIDLPTIIRAKFNEVSERQGFPERLRAD
jgi:NTP pyrophosphatase (non-canonical NTP hydrolase)